MSNARPVPAAKRKSRVPAVRPAPRATGGKSHPPVTVMPPEPVVVPDAVLVGHGGLPRPYRVPPGVRTLRIGTSVYTLEGMDGDTRVFRYIETERAPG